MSCIFNMLKTKKESKPNLKLIFLLSGYRWGSPKKEEDNLHYLFIHKTNVSEAIPSVKEIQCDIPLCLLFQWQ